MHGLKLLSIFLLVGLTSCQTERTVYDEFGRVVPQDKKKSGGERSFESYLEENYDRNVQEKKTESGVPQTYSTKVSSFQSKLDDSKRLDKTYLTGEYGGAGKESSARKEYAGSGTSAYADHRYAGEAREKRIDRELHPAFASGSRGIYATEDEYVGRKDVPAISGKESGMGGEFPTEETAVFSRNERSGYFETRAENTPPPPIYSRDEYYSKTIQDVRSLLGRDKKED